MIRELHLADNLVLLKWLYEQGHREFVDLVYLDPPYNSKRNYNLVFDAATNTSELAFTDTWSNVAYLDELEQINKISPNLYAFLRLLETTGLPKGYISYLTAMTIRCWYMREMLKKTGTFFYHCDPTASHYIKIMLDYIFGMNNFKNEIVWCYAGGGSSKTRFPEKHDIIFMYGKTEHSTFNQDEVRVPYDSNYKGTSFVAEGTRAQGKTYTANPKGKVVEDWWTGISRPYGKDVLGYPTQKPEALLERIIKSSCPPEGLVADFYMGGGTTLAVAHKLGRQFIGSDINYRAIQITKERLEKLGLELKRDFFIFGTPKSSVELRQLVNDNILGKDKNSRFALEEIIVKFYLKGVTGNEKKVGDSSIDGVFGFTVNNKSYRGLVQVTSGSNKNHLKAFCSEVAKGEGQIGVYVTFADCVTDGFIQEVKSYGKIHDVDRIQILTIEDLVDNGKQPTIPTTQGILFG